MRAVTAIPAIGLLTGSAVGLFLPQFSFAVLIPAFAVCAGAAAWALGRGQARLLAAAVAAGFSVGGAALAANAWQEAWRPTVRVAFEELARAQRAEATLAGRALPEDDSAFAVLTGVLRADAAPGPAGVSLSLDVESIRVHAPGSGASGLLDSAERSVGGGVLLTIVGTLASDRMVDWRAGRLVSLPAQLRRPARYLDPGVPDQERALARRGTILVGTVKSGALVDVLARGHPFSEASAAVRAFARRSIAAAVGRWSPRSSAIVTAIVIGDRAGLDDDVQRRLQEAGTYHVVAISGGNIAILAGLLIGGFRLAGLLGRAAMLSAAAALIAYGYLVGGGASVDRASLMAVVYFAGRALDQRAPTFNALALVAGALVWADPLSIVDSAFLLTFGATAAILASVPIVRARALPWPLTPLATILVASVAAEAALFPVGAIVFSRVTFAGLALNFLAIPLMGIAQIAGMAVVPTSALSSAVAAAIGWVAHAGAEGLVRSADLVRFAPALTWRVAPPDWPAVAIYYAGLVTGWTLWRWRTRVAGSAEPQAWRALRRVATAVAAAAAIWILAEPWTLLASHGDGGLHVTFLDVGQGDAAFVRFPRGATLLVDAGGLPAASSFDVGDRVVAPVLRGAGVGRLDDVALTHGDPDHIGGAMSILREFRPRGVWEGIPVPPLEPLHALWDTAQEIGARWANVKAGDQVSVDGVRVVVRHPDTADWERQKVRNDDSIVLELLWRDVSIVLTGDIGKAVEREMAAAFPRVPLRVVKVPHHGSLTSSTLEFLRALAPRIAVVSVGRGNHFGHPVPQVIERYRQVGAEIFRTDRDGAVMVDSDGKSVHVHTFTGRTFSVR